MITPWGQTKEIARRDLLVERRTGETMSIVIPFAALALALAPLALPLSTDVLPRIGPALYWLIALLFGLQATIRSTTEDAAVNELEAMAGVDPAVRFAGRAIAAAVLALVVLAILAPLMVILYAPSSVPGWPAIVPSVVLLAAGLGMLGVLTGDLTRGLRHRGALAPFLAVPLGIPLLMGAAQGFDALSRGAGILTWTLLLLATDLVLVIVGVVSARHLQEARL